jgi:DNA-binding transcriptional ArsR family regulator
MQENRADVIFHPVRIRIVQALFGDRRLTAYQLVEALGGPSIATLYRHLNRLVEAGIVAVVEERPIRGALEKVYALAHDRAATIEADELRQISREDHSRHFTTFIGALLHDYGRYLGQERFDMAEEGVIVRQESLNLTDAEARQISGVLKEALAPYRQIPPDASRRRRLLTLVLLPEVEATNQPQDPE